MAANTEVWRRLGHVAAVQFKSISHSTTGWSGSGSGMVQVAAPAPHVLVFDEAGVWRPDGGKEMRFTNVFRWSLIEEHLRLEHLRFGPDKPVFLFDMAADDEGVWREIMPHPCRDDCYRSSLRLDEGRIMVQWLVRGPQRDEVIDYVYI